MQVYILSLSWQSSIINDNDRRKRYVKYKKHKKTEEFVERIADGAIVAHTKDFLRPVVSPYAEKI